MVSQHRCQLTVEQWPFPVGGSSKSKQVLGKGIPWTEEEHGLFLLDLEKFGKGDWRSISRNFVISRTPKYFIRLNSLNRERRRSSIHDISSISGDVMSTGPHYHHNQHQQHPPKVKQWRPNGTMIGLGNLYGGGAPIRQSGVHSHRPPFPPPAIGTTPIIMPPPHHHLHHQQPQHHPPYVLLLGRPMPPPLAPANPY